MRFRIIKLWIAGFVAVALAGGGCGDSASSTPATTTIDFKSPAVNANGIIPPSHPCGGGALWLPLEWGSVPSDTKELAIYIGRFRYDKAGGAKKLIVPFGELISGIEPSLRQNPASVLPEGASWSYFGVSCPPERSGQHVLQIIFALDRARPESNLDKRLATRLTEEALDHEWSNGNQRSPGSLTEDAVGIGQFTATFP